MKKQAARASLVACITDRKEDFYRLAYSYVKNQEDALDIVQNQSKKRSIPSILFAIRIRLKAGFTKFWCGRQSIFCANGKN